MSWFGFGDLKPGDTSPEVGDWQTNLRDAGYSNVAVTGTYDDATWSATVDFKASVGLPENGVVDDVTVAAMNQKFSWMNTQVPGKRGYSLPRTTENPISITGGIVAVPWLALGVVAVGAWWWSQR